MIQCKLLRLALLALAAPPALATDADLSRLLNLSLEELLNTPLVTASRREESRAETPAHIVVVTREQIRERRYHNLADLMEDLPGVDFMRGTKSSAYNNFAVQGYAGPNKILVMLDGIRVGHPAGGNFPIAENFSLHMAKQVEILYGPAAALYGADAVAGVINIISEPASRNGGSVNLSSGNFSSQEASFQGGLKNDSGLAFSLGGHWQSSDRAPLHKYYPAEFTPVDAVTQGGVVVTPAAARESYVGGIDSHSFQARLDYEDRASVGYYRNHFRSLTSTGDRPATAYYREDAHWDTTTDTVWAKLRFQAAADVSGEFVVDYSLQEVAPSSKYMNIYTAFGEGYEYVYGRRLSLEQNFNWRVDERHRVLAGLGWQDFRAIEAHSLPSPYNTDLGPDAQGLFYRNTPLPLAIHDSEYDNLSLYAQMQSQWSETFSTMAGLRHDRHSDYGNSLNARLGAVWHPVASHYFKVLYGEAFRAPSPEESLSSFGSFDGVPDAFGNFIGRGFRIPNFNLEPEQAKTLSLTWDWRPQPELNVMANAYHNRSENLIITGPRRPDDTTTIPGATLIGSRQKINAGWQRQTGLDLIAQYRFQLDDQWTGDAWGTLGWIRGRIRDTQGVWEIPFAPHRKLKIGTTFRYLGKLSITPMLRWTDEVSNEVKGATPPSRRHTSGYAVTDLHVGWRDLANTGVSAWLDVTNLFDKRYYEAAGSGTFFDMPQQPRTWMLSLEYDF